MTTVYSDHYTISGLSVGGYRAKLTYSTSTSNTAVTITWSATVQMKYAAQYGVGITCESKTGTGYITSSSSSYVDVKTISGTTTVSKGTSATTKKITAKAYGTTVSGYTSAGGSSSISASISIPALASYTVSYDANGGSGAPSSQTKYYGKTLTLSSTVPTRDGYTFAGWGTSASATGVSYAAGGSYTSNAAITLYAVWTVNKMLTIQYDANGGEDAPSSQTHIYDTTSTLSSSEPTRDGYTFLGWSTDSTATTATYAAGASYTNDDFEDGDVVTLYAVWEKLDYCIIAYDANGGTSAPESQEHVINTESTLSDVQPTRDGYKFLGWSTDSAATSAMYFSKGTYVNNDFTNGSTITMYAVWLRIINVHVRIPDGNSLKGVYIRVS